jgi:predicted nuclease of predicted toxin-antitoxin system
VLDENVPLEVLYWLRQRYPDCTSEHVVQIFPGKSDREVLTYATGQQAVVVTFDEDFGDLRHFPLGTHSGIIRLRVWPTTAQLTIEALAQVFESVSADELRGALVIVDSNRIRLRRPPNADSP